MIRLPITFIIGFNNPINIEFSLLFYKKIVIGEVKSSPKRAKFNLIKSRFYNGFSKLFIVFFLNIFFTIRLSTLDLDELLQS